MLHVTAPSQQCQKHLKREWDDEESMIHRLTLQQKQGGGRRNRNIIRHV